MTHAHTPSPAPAPAWTAFVGTVAIACASYLYMQVPASAEAAAAGASPARPTLQLNAEPCATTAVSLLPAAPVTPFRGTRLALPMPRRRQRPVRPESSMHAFLARLMAAWHEWRQRAHSRDELAGFDEHALRDIGVARSQAAFESGKRFWQR